VHPETSGYFPKIKIMSNMPIYPHLFTKRRKKKEPKKKEEKLTTTNICQPFSGSDL